MKKRIAYWIFNYQPQWEAASREMDLLRREMSGQCETSVVSFNLRMRRLRLWGHEKHVPLPHGLVSLPFLRRFASRFSVNHIFASPGEYLLTGRIAGPHTIMTLAKDARSLNSIERNVERLKRLRFIVAESERHFDILRQAGIKDESLRLILPGISKQSYVPASGTFKILFATSPASKNELLLRGVPLMIRVAASLPDARFVFVWRDRFVSELMALIREARADNVEVRNGLIKNMDEVYDEIHATILPGLDYHSFKPCPHSAIESLAHGKPVIVSRPTSISRLIESYRCGVVFEPTTEALLDAVAAMRSQYDELRRNCQKLVEDRFSVEGFVQGYRRLYQELLGA